MKRGSAEWRLIEFELQESRGILAQDLHLRLGFQRQGVELFEDPSRLDEGVVAAEEGSILQPAADLAHQLLGVVARGPTPELDMDVRLVQRHRDQLQVPGPAEMCSDNLQLRKARRHHVQMNRPGRVELDPLPARLSGPDAAGTGVKQAGDLQLHRLFPEPEMPLVAGIEILERGVELGTFGPEFGDGALQLLHGIRFPWVDRGEEGEALRMPLDNGGDEIVG